MIHCVCRRHTSMYLVRPSPPSPAHLAPPTARPAPPLGPHLLLIRGHWRGKSIASTWNAGTIRKPDRLYGPNQNCVPHWFFIESKFNENVSLMRKGQRRLLEIRRDRLSGNSDSSRIAWSRPIRKIVENFPTHSFYIGRVMRDPMCYRCRSFDSVESFVRLFY